jgi:glycosyltransferase involved in cell wall biosynthesis
MSAKSIPQSMPALRGAPLRVAYDARALVSGDGGTGKGMQLRNLIDSRWAQFQGYAPPAEKQRLPAGIVQGGNGRYLIWQQASLPRLLKPWRPDVFLAPYNTAPLLLPRRTRLVLVLHDLILLQSFGTTTTRARIVNGYRRRLIPLSVARSSYVLTVSEFSRDRILEHFPKARVVVIPCTIADSWFVRPHHPQRRENYILLVTAPPPHKNTARALRAYARYVTMAGPGAANLRIVGLAGAGESFPAIVRELRLNERVAFEPFVSTTTLQSLYRSAKAVLVPSLLEGFGIPVLEGMASGTPVITSRSSSLSEVGGEAVQYFDPLDETSIATSIFALSDNPALSIEKVREGYMQAAKFHPRIVHRQVDEFWFQVASEHAAAPWL